MRQQLQLQLLMLTSTPPTTLPTLSKRRHKSPLQEERLPLTPLNPPFLPTPLNPPHPLLPTLNPPSNPPTALPNPLRPRRELLPTRGRGTTNLRLNSTTASNLPFLPVPLPLRTECPLRSSLLSAAVAEADEAVVVSEDEEVSTSCTLSKGRADMPLSRPLLAEVAVELAVVGEVDGASLPAWRRWGWEWAGAATAASVRASPTAASALEEERRVVLAAEGVEDALAASLRRAEELDDRCRVFLLPPASSPPVLAALL